ncbi:MAG TPA: hypothetical protein VJ900_02655 [Patescibacteria group bacterium]|nr:hypothetical protein [Patescibacteria group bacterium]
MAKDFNKKDDFESQNFGDMNPEVDEYRISLIPKKIVVIPRVVKSRFLLFVASLVVIITIFGVVWLYTNLHFEKVGDRVHKLRGEIRLLEGKTASYLGLRDRIENLHKKSSRVDDILDSHIYWTKFFALLEKNTIPNVFFGDFSARVSGSINLQATARDLLSLARQLVAFRQADNFAKEVRLSGIRKSPEGVGGVFDIVLLDGVFNK